MSDVLSVTIDSEEVVGMLSRAPAATRKTVGQLIEGSAIDVQREMRIQAPVAVTGDLRRSIRYVYSPVSLTAEVTANVPYAHDVEHGTSAHYVDASPGSSLARWADQKGLNPYAVRANIAKRGTKAHPFAKPTFDKMKPIVESYIAEGIAKLVGDLNNGRI